MGRAAVCGHAVQTVGIADGNDTTPMEVDAVMKGKGKNKGKGKGKGKGKEKSKGKSKDKPKEGTNSNTLVGVRCRDRL